MTKQTRTYGFRVATEKWADKPCVVVRVLAREGEASSPINPRIDGESSFWDAPKRLDGMMLKGLTLRAYVSDYEPSGFTVRAAEFEDVTYVNAACAAAMLKTLRKIAAETRKTPVETLPGYIECVARVIGASWTVFETRQGRDWSYSSSDWNFAPVDSAKVEASMQLNALAPKPVEPKPDTPDYVVFDDDPEGLSERKRAQYEADGTPICHRVLEACAYQKGNAFPIRSLGDIDFAEDGGDWIRGRFYRVSEIPECCPHLRGIAKDMGLPE